VTGGAMRIGIDFDNTLVSYDRLFHRIAGEAGVIPADLPITKTAVRDHLRAVDRENYWTEMQGEVYGARMGEAEIFPGAFDFIRWSVAQGIELAIISHKTRHPYRGPQHDLHAAARGWVDTSLVLETVPLIPPERVYFEFTKEAKLARIGTLGCDYFIDDLLDILQAPGFPSDTARILFAPHGLDAAVPNIVALDNWKSIRAYFEARHACDRPTTR
jgi:hypothetical protein